MNRLKLLTLSLGILNILTGGILTIFIILMQNPLALVMGILYVVFGVSVLINKTNKKILFFGMIPLTILFSISIIMSAVDKDIPQYSKIPLHISLLIIIPLWLLIFGNIYKKSNKGAGLNNQQN